MSTNIAIITGRLGKEPELKATPSGKSVCGFSLAVDDGYGEKKKTSWIYCEAWDKTAEAVARLVGVGKRVTVVGRLKEDSWEDQNGNKRSRLKVLAQSVDIIDFIEKEDTSFDTDSIG